MQTHTHTLYNLFECVTHHSGSSQVLLFQQCSMTSLLSHTAVLTLCSKRFPVIEKKLQNEKANKTTLGLHSLHCHFELTQGHFRSSFRIFSCQKCINVLTFICHCIKMCFFLRQGHTLISEMLDCTYVFVCVCVSLRSSVLLWGLHWAGLLQWICVSDRFWLILSKMDWLSRLHAAVPRPWAGRPQPL